MYGSVVTMQSYLLVLLLWLNLVATMGCTPAEQRSLTVLTEWLLLLGAQWLGPIAMGWVVDHARATLCDIC